MNMRGAVAERNHCANSTELLFRFFKWATDLGRVPLPEEIAERYQVVIATAYRWRNAWCDANGLPLPEKRPMGTRPDHFNRAPRQHYARARTERTRETSRPAATGTPSNTDQRPLK